MNFNKARRIANGRLRQISLSARDGQSNFGREATRQQIERFLRDRMVAASAARNMFPDCSDTDIERLSELHDLFSPCTEPVYWRLLRKRSGGYRPVCKFGPELQLRHRLVKHALDAALPAGAPFYDIRGTGCGRAVTELAEAISTVGPHVLIADIHDCFQSINVDALYSLDILPPEVVRYALDYRSLSIEPERRRGQRIVTTRYQTRETGDVAVLHTANSLGSAGLEPQGLLGGSQASNAILRHLLLEVIDRIDFCLRVFVYVDNFFVVAPTADICSQFREALSSILAECRAGPLLLGSFELCEVEHGFEALGYSIMRDANGTIHIQPDDRGLGRLMSRLRELDPIDLSSADLINERTRELLAPFPAVDPQFRELFGEEVTLAAELRS